MPSVLGHIIVIAILAVPVFFAGRYCLRDIKGALSSGSCGGCTGECSSCGGGCSCSSSSSGGTSMNSSGAGVKGSGASKGPKRYGINGKIVTIPDPDEIRKL